MKSVAKYKNINNNVVYTNICTQVCARTHNFTLSCGLL